MSIFWVSRTSIGARTSSPVSRAIELRFTSAKGIKDVGAHGYGSGQTTSRTARGMQVARSGNRPASDNPPLGYGDAGWKTPTAIHFALDQKFASSVGERKNTKGAVVAAPVCWRS